VERFSPAAEELAQLIARNENAAIKLAPASELPEAWPPNVEREWISRDGECRQQTAWFGKLMQSPGERRATLVNRQGSAARTIVGSESQDIPLGTTGRYLYEPDAAVIASRLAGQLAAECGLTALATGVAYMTCDKLLQDAALAAFEVQDVLPFDIKRLKAWLKSRGVGRVEVKSRDPRTEANQLARQLSAKGESVVTLIIAPTPEGVRAIFAQRITQASRNP
jgi:hypothetical protein